MMNGIDLVVGGRLLRVNGFMAIEILDYYPFKRNYSIK